MKQQPAGNGTSILAMALLTAAFIWAAVQLGPPLIGGQIRPWPALMHLMAGVAFLRLVIRVLELLAMAADWKRTRTPTGKSGTAGWATKRDFKKELSQ